MGMQQEITGLVLIRFFLRRIAWMMCMIMTIPSHALCGEPAKGKKLCCNIYSNMFFFLLRDPLRCNFLANHQMAGYLCRRTKGIKYSLYTPCEPLPLLELEIRWNSGRRAVKVWRGGMEGRDFTDWKCILARIHPDAGDP